MSGGTAGGRARETGGRARETGGPPAEGATLKTALLLFALSTAFGLAVYARTLGMAFAWDDMDYLDVAADALSGKAPLLETLFRPHQEHLTPVTRALFHLNLAVFGAVNAFPVRLAMLLFHALSATGMALVARRLLGGPAGPIAALAYVVPAGFSSMWLFIPAGGGIPIGLAGIAWASAAVVHQEQLGRRLTLLLAGLAMGFALLAENTMAPLLATPWLLHHLVRWRAGLRKPDIAFTALAAALGGGLVLLFSKLYERAAGAAPSWDLLAGLPRAAFLLVTAPFRYLFPGLLLQFQESGDRRVFIATTEFGLGLLALLAVALVFATRGNRGSLAALAALAAGPFAWVALVGVARFRTTFWELWFQDRYYFPLLIPASFLAAILGTAIARGLARGERRVVAVLAASFFAPFLLSHRSALHSRVSFEFFEKHERRFASLARLVDALDASGASASRPERFPDGTFSFPDVHNGRVSARLLLHGLVPGKPRGFTLGEPSEAGAAKLNEVLARWALGEGDPAASFEIRNGRIEAAAAGPVADFRAASHDPNVISGFHAWEGSWRWMPAEGHLRLTLAGSRLSLLVAAPVTKILASKPEWKSVVLRIAVLDPATRARVPLEEVLLTGDAPLFVTRSLPEPFASKYRNAQIELVLESPTVWRPNEVLAGSTDGRELSVMVYMAGFGD